MFKKRNVEKKTDINKDLSEIVEQVQIEKEDHVKVPKLLASKKINKFSNKIQKYIPPQKITSNKELNNQFNRNDSNQINQKAINIQYGQNQANHDKQEIQIRYGLISKQDVNSKYHSLQESDETKKQQPNSLVSLYVKKKMDEINKNADRKYQASDEIMQMQRKYLESNKERLAEYDSSEIQKKLENMATNAIKNQIAARQYYLGDLLENEHERMEYASKKQLKTIRQEKQRLQKNFQSKYNDSGRRGFVQKMKYEAMLNN